MGTARLDLRITAITLWQVRRHSHIWMINHHEDIQQSLLTCSLSLSLSFFLSFFLSFYDIHSLTLTLLLKQPSRHPSWSSPRVEATTSRRSAWRTAANGACAWRDGRRPPITPSRSRRARRSVTGWCQRCTWRARMRVLWRPLGLRIWRSLLLSYGCQNEAMNLLESPWTVMLVCVLSKVLW